MYEPKAGDKCVLRDWIDALPARMIAPGTKCTVIAARNNRTVDIRTEMLEDEHEHTIYNVSSIKLALDDGTETW